MCNPERLNKLKEIQTLVNEYLVKYEDIYPGDEEKFMDLEDYLREESMCIKVNQGY